MTETSARFALPLLLPGQAQKEVYHNEALTLVDAALHPCVEEGPLSAPPAAPEEGQSWIVGPAAIGAWAGQTDRLAAWTAGGWRYITPVPGMLVWNLTQAIGCIGTAPAGAMARYPSRRSRSTASKCSVPAFRRCQVLLAEQ